VLMVDPYLSDDAATLHGLDRQVAPPFPPAAIHPAFLLVSHPHVDHLDPSTVRYYGALGTVTLVAAPETVREARESLGWRGPAVELAAGGSATLGAATVEATWTRHSTGPVALGPEECVGFLITLEGMRFWHLGDTEYDARLHRGGPSAVDVALLPINGGGGNMNAAEAALLAWQLAVGVAIPMHFGMWSPEAYTYGGAEPWATPTPEPFVATYAALDPTGAVIVPVLGEVLTFPRETAPGVEVPGEASR
jgi:L-ascorbate metabolism protein UlaG (beta-lactamase superfamily)